MTTTAAHGVAAGIIADDRRQTNGTPPPTRSRVTTDEKGNITLPPVPVPDDNPGQCAWLTDVFSLDPARPIVGAEHQGVRGANGHVVLRRAGAPEIRFEPASRINAPAKLIEDLTWQTLPDDGAAHALKAGHCRDIAHVVRMLCGASRSLTARQEAAGILGTFLQAAVPAEEPGTERLTAHGTSQQRFEAARALSREGEGDLRPHGPARYLVDAKTGEHVIRVSDLADAARRHVGSSLPRGWLDARMQELGWDTATLDGHRDPGRNGRTGPHLRARVYRGRLETQDA